MWFLICSRTSLQYVGKMIKSWRRFPSLLVNNKFNRSNVEFSRVNIEQPNIINQYNMPIGEVNHMDQIISVNMINLRTKKWWWPLFRFVVDVAVQIYRESHLNPGNIDWMPLAFAEALLMRTTPLQKVCRLQHYSQVVAPYIPLQTICKLTISITGLPRDHGNDVAYQNVKEPH